MMRQWQRRHQQDQQDQNRSGKDLPLCGLWAGAASRPDYCMGRFLVNKIQGFRHRKMSRLYGRCPPARRQRLVARPRPALHHGVQLPGFVDQSPHVDTALAPAAAFKRRDVIFSADFTNAQRDKPCTFSDHFRCAHFVFVICNAGSWVGLLTMTSAFGTWAVIRRRAAARCILTE